MSQTDVADLMEEMGHGSWERQTVGLVEAAKRSGALSTAARASEYDREVFAVPGRVDADASRGTNALIRDGVTQEGRRQGCPVEFSWLLLGKEPVVVIRGPNDEEWVGHGPDDTTRLVAAAHKMLDGQEQKP